MSEFTIRFKTDNAAFHEDDGTATADALAAGIVATLLGTKRSILREIDGEETSGVVKDINGNSIGNWQWKED